MCILRLRKVEECGDKIGFTVRSKKGGKKRGLTVRSRKKEIGKIRLSPEAGEPEQKMLRKDETLGREVLIEETTDGYDHPKS